jgi:four helix bundle protein
MTIQSYRDLRVWQVGMDLVESVYRLSADFPAREVYGLASQMRRAAVSIPSNIAEGYTKEGTREYLYHLSIAQGSLAELQTQIEIAGRLVYLAPEQVSAVLDRTIHLAKQLYALRNALLRRNLP